MNINVRALVFGAAIAAALTMTMNTIAAEAPQQVVLLDGITVTAHRGAPVTTDDVDVVRLDPVIVAGHRAVA